MRRLAYILVITAFGCSAPIEESMVRSIGELRQIMHEGKFQARVRLDTIVKANSYGLGAMNSLTGEILILNGKVHQSFIQQDSLIVSNDANSEATLLVYANVAAWDTLSLSPTTDLEFELKKVKDLSIPFPFMLIGKPSLDYHVINFDVENGDFSKHKEGAFNGSLANEDVTILGFYSENAKGIYTHHDSNMHMHVVNADQTVMGHVDQIDLADGSYQLLIPRQ